MPMKDITGVPTTGAPPFSNEWYAELARTLGDSGCKQLGFFALPPDFLLTVVMPVYNEEQSLSEIVRRVASVRIRKEIILVDDHSTDRSRAIMEQLADQVNGTDSLTSLVLRFHDRNRGKGAALRTGFSAASGDVVIIQDADLEYDPAEYPRLLQPIVDGRADVVYGSRFLGHGPHRVLYYWHYLGNRFLTCLSNCLTNLNLTDMETCYKAFRREALTDILPTLRQDRFGFEPEVTAKISRRRYRVYEVAISYSGRTYDQGKKIGWRDGINALWCILRYAVRD